MKKLLSLVLVGVMLLTMASFAFAGTITWGGNLRFWYMDVMGPNDSMTTFQFDRVALTFKDAFSDHDGVNAEFQWRNYSSNDGTITSTTKYVGAGADGTVGTADDVITTTTTYGGSKQARLDSGYYYYDGLLGKGDELQIGALSKLPFRLGLSKNCNFADTGLGSKFKIGNCVGISYEMDADRYTVGVGIADGNQKDITNDEYTYEGYIYSLRLDAGKNFFGLVPGLRLGTGYNRQANATAKLYNANNYTTNEVIDLAYVTNRFWVSVEKVSSTVTTNGADADALKGTYAEIGMNIGKSKVWAGRMINDDEDKPLLTYKDTLTPDNLITGIRNGNIVAAIVPILSTSELQFQYIWGDDYKGADTGKEIDLRLQVKF